MLSYKQFLNNHFFDKRLAHVLGIGALAPFVLLSIGCWIVHPDWIGDLVRGQLSYGIAILSFIGGIHWGAALLTGDMSGEETKKVLLWGVAPAILAWVGVLIDVGLGFALSMACFILAYRFDRRMYPQYHMPEWVLTLRYRLTCVVIGAQLLTLIAVNVRA
ncbi:MAG: hypothetical protein H6R04_1885 [Burkholderiaceae bacterium]|nr:hypothetical protein [Burkholderiaceae bacterium]